MRRKRKGCLICGGTKTVKAVDNFGKPYIGCANCRILSLPEIQALLVVEEGPPK